MSINLTVRSSAATSGGTNQTIPGDGAIDTKEEAEAALSFLPEGSTDKVMVGDTAYTRAQLLEIRDRAAAAPAAPVAPGAPGAPAPQAEGDKIVGDGVSHGFSLQGLFAGGLGDKGHSGGGIKLGYIPGITLRNGTTRLFLDPIIGFTAGHSSSAYKTPGNEDVSSAFTNYGALVGAGLRLVPNFADHRLSFGVGPNLGVGGFSTAASKTVSTPKQCTPGDFGRSECEPKAGGRTGNAGTQGLMNFDAGSARGTSGVFIDPSVDVTVGVDIVRGDWGNLQGTAALNAGGMILSPSDGHGFSYGHVGGALGVRGNFGGGAVEKPAVVVAPPPPPPAIADKDGDGVPDAEDKCPDVKGTKENKGCPDLEAGVTSSPASVKPQEKFPVGISVKSDSKIDVSVSFKGADGKITNSNANVARKGDGTYPFEVPANLKSGKYTLVVTLEDMKTGVTKVEEKEIVIVENVNATLPGSFAPGQPPTIQNVKVVGLEKLEGVTYVIEGFDKEKKSVGTLDSSAITKGDKSWTLDEKKGTRIPLAGPGNKGFQKDINYVVTLKNKEGLPVWTGSFEVGQATAFRRRGAK